jgi:hypothetical protein
LRRLECGAHRSLSVDSFIFASPAISQLRALSLAATSLSPGDLRRICADMTQLRALDISYNAYTLGPAMRTMTQLSNLTALVQICIIDLEAHVHPELVADFCASSIRIIQCRPSRIRPYASDKAAFDYADIPSFDEAICLAWR